MYSLPFSFCHTRCLPIYSYSYSTSSFLVICNINSTFSKIRFLWTSITSITSTKYTHIIWAPIFQFYLTLPLAFYLNYPCFSIWNVLYAFAHVPFWVPQDPVMNPERLLTKRTGPSDGVLFVGTDKSLDDLVSYFHGRSFSDCAPPCSYPLLYFSGMYISLQPNIAQLI